MDNNLTLIHEVIDSPLKAQIVAEAQSSVSRYKYRASALLAGYPPLRPYDPIYLTGLDDGMSGVWVVIEINHQFSIDLAYAMRVVLGSNDDLLSIKSSKATDISEDVVNVTPQIIYETDSLLTYRESKEKDYIIEEIDYPKLSNSEDYNSRLYNPLKEYLDLIDSNNFNQNTVQDNNQFNINYMPLLNNQPYARWVRR
jgi:hypothetical protein